MRSNKKNGKSHLFSFVLLGKHSPKDGRGKKSGEAGSTVCLFCFTFSVLLVGGSKVNVALGPKLMGVGNISFLCALETRPTMSNPGKNVVLGSLATEEWLPFLNTTDVRVL